MVLQRHEHPYTCTDLISFACPRQSAPVFCGEIVDELRTEMLSVMLKLIVMLMHGTRRLHVYLQ